MKFSIVQSPIDRVSTDSGGSFARSEKRLDVMREERLNTGGRPSYPLVIALLGPTAVGKSRHALELCREFGGVILSADSRQVYRYMDICTAKPTPEERASVPHYMIDLVEPEESYTAQRFAEEGQRVLAAAESRRQPVFVVGGTGFYVSVLLDRRAMPAITPDYALRLTLRDEAESAGSDALHRRLQRVDPTSAGRIHPNNLPRLIRALEIVEKTGKPIPRESDRVPMPACYIGLQMERSTLHQVADRRIDEQMRLGLVEEVATLLQMGYAPALPALDGLGYRQMIQFIQGEVTREEAVARYKIATHQYIRRQLTWFRKDPRIEWVHIDASTGSTLRERVTRYLSTVS
jgi:tRNA dimethylallyltransferase